MLNFFFGILCITFIGLYIAFYQLSKPESDETVVKELKTGFADVSLTRGHFKNFEYRKVSIRKDTALPTIIFVHGTIGSAMNFKEYLIDNSLLQKANLISYDRIGYNYKDKYQVQESIAFEAEMLDSIIDNDPNTIVVGYSYGGPIALAAKTRIKNIILIAPAVYGKVEPMPFLLNIYKWRFTRWTVPHVWKQAAKEKMSHREDLSKFEDHWNQNKNQILSIHGNTDWIVPYENSLFLQRQFPGKQFKLITVDDAGHELVWSHKELIKKELLKLLD